jgi:hypothetical protein
MGSVVHEGRYSNGRVAPCPNLVSCCGPQWCGETKGSGDSVLRLFLATLEAPTKVDLSECFASASQARPFSAVEGIPFPPSTS